MLDLHSQQTSNEVSITDIRMPFWSMVRFMVKLALASIPAMIIFYLILLGFVIAALLLLSSIGFVANYAKSTPNPPMPTVSLPEGAKAVPESSPSVAAVSGKGYAALKSEDFGEHWPLTVSKARIWCEPGGAILLISNNTVYNVNEAAMKAYGYPAIEAITATDADGNPKDLSPLIRQGLSLCR